MKSHSDILKLLKHIKMDNVFHADHLRKAADDSMLDQIQDSEPLTEVNDQPEYTVKKILAS